VTRTACALWVGRPVGPVLVDSVCIVLRAADMARILGMVAPPDVRRTNAGDQMIITPCGAGF
jgi:hypothetical protein